MLRFKKLKSFKPNIDELTVFIRVSIPNLKASSILIFKIVNREEIINKEIINTKSDKNIYKDQIAQYNYLKKRIY